MLRLFAVIPVVLAVSLAGADGLMLPVEPDYPHDFLRNRMTHVEVEMHGVVAVTSVYQEFVNEWHRETGAVYSFPLPPDARATEILYWRGGKVLEAVLRVRDQAVNPGTGEGGAAALVNRYLGRNGIRIRLDGIAPQEIQRVQLTYIGLCDYKQGECRYRYPLDTSDFVKRPLDHLQFNFIVRSNSNIVDFGLPTHPEYRTVHSAPKELEIEFSQPKSYLNRDLEFFYTVEQNALGVDFYSAANDNSDGHFALFCGPKTTLVKGGCCRDRCSSSLPIPPACSVPSWTRVSVRLQEPLNNSVPKTASTSSCLTIGFRRGSRFRLLPTGSTLPQRSIF